MHILPTNNIEQTVRKSRFAHPTLAYLTNLLWENWFIWR